MNLSLAKALDRRLGGLLCRALSARDSLASLLSREPEPIREVKAIAVVKFWGIGNWALLRPVVADLKARWPFARLAIVTLDSNAPLVEDLADELILVRTRRFSSLARDLALATRRLARFAPQLCVDFEQFSTTGTLLARAAGIPQRVGFESGARGRDALLTVRVPFRDHVHASRSFRDLVEAAGVPAAPYAPGSLTASAEGLAEVDALLAAAAGPDALSADAPLVVLHPGSGDNFPGRRWSDTGFAAVGRHARERYGARVVVTGSPSEQALCQRVALAVGEGAVVAAGRLGIRGLIALLDRARVLVSNDTGPVHIASALHRPVLALFGPNTPVLYGPLSPGSVSFFKGLPCSPCLKTDNYRSSRCRIHTCMAAVSTGEVLAALDRTMQSTVPATPEAAWVGASR